MQVGPLPPGFSPASDSSDRVRASGRPYEVDPRKSVWLVADPGAVRRLGRPTLYPGVSLQEVYHDDMVSPIFFRLPYTCTDQFPFDSYGFLFPVNNGQVKLK